MAVIKMHKEGTIFDLKRYSIHDGPGIRTTIFLKGCPLACKWCHNPESLSIEPQVFYTATRCINCGNCQDLNQEQPAEHEKENFEGYKNNNTNFEGAKLCPSNALELCGQQMTVEEVLEEVEKDLLFYEQSKGGVTFSGGEPLFQSKFLLELIAACKKAKLHTVLDTCAFAPRSAFEKAASQVDLLLLDLKMMDPVLHKKYTGVDNKLILANASMLKQIGTPTFVRIPVIPGLNDDRNNILETTEFALSLGVVQRIHLLPFHDTGMGKYDRLGMKYSFSGQNKPQKENLEKLAELVESKGMLCKIEG